MPIEVKKEVLCELRKFVKANSAKKGELCLPSGVYVLFIVEVIYQQDSYRFDNMIVFTSNTRQACLKSLEDFILHINKDKFLIGVAFDPKGRFIVDEQEQLYVVFNNPKSYDHYPLVLEKKPKPNAIVITGERNLTVFEKPTETRTYQYGNNEPARI